ncbi:hypothetical protein HGI15_22475, partial [Modestobacter lapidis]|nr:hypothetical protein [Modestobacter lapidis]
VGYRTTLNFAVTQSNRDKYLMNSFINFFNCGYLTKDNKESCINYKITSFKDNYNIIIPFFEKYSI